MLRGRGDVGVSENLVFILTQMTVKACQSFLFQYKVVKFEYCLTIMCFFILKWKMFLMISIIPLNFHHAYSVSFKFFLQ